MNPNRKSNPFLLPDIEADWTPPLPSAGTQKDICSESGMERTGDVANTAPPRMPVGKHTVDPLNIADTETSSLRSGGNVSSIGSAPPIPRNRANLGMLGNQQSAPAMGTTRHIYADTKHPPEGNLWQQSSQSHGLRIGIIEGASGGLTTKNSTTVQSPQQNEPSQGREVLRSFDTLSFGHQRPENDPGDLLGGDVDDEVGWRPLLR